MVTRILFDPRRDLPTGSTTSTAVVVEATPTGIREDGSVVVLPTTLSFPVDTADDVVQLAATTASWKWRLTIRDAVTNLALQQRTVLVPDATSVAYQDLPDVDPASLGNTQSSARNWDATFAQILELIPSTAAGNQSGLAVGDDGRFYLGTSAGLNVGPDGRSYFASSTITHTVTAGPDGRPYPVLIGA